MSLQKLFEQCHSEFTIHCKKVWVIIAVGCLQPIGIKNGYSNLPILHLFKTPVTIILLSVKLKQNVEYKN